MANLYITKLPFPGYIQSTVYEKDGKQFVSLSGKTFNKETTNSRGHTVVQIGTTEDLTVEEYAEAKGLESYAVINDDQLDEYFNGVCDGLKTNPEEITKERYWDMLEILPPCRWHHIGSTEVFHVSERITMNMVSWFANHEGKYYEFTQDATIEDSELLELLKGVSDE